MDATKYYQDNIKINVLRILKLASTVNKTLISKILNHGPSVKEPDMSTPPVGVIFSSVVEAGR